MSSNKKSFLLHIDSLDILDELTDEECGLLFKAIKAHHTEEDIKLSGLVRVAFSPFRNQFNRDDEKYNLTCERRAQAGSKGGKQKVANASKSKQKAAKVAESVSDNKNDNDSDSKNKSDNKKIAAQALNFDSWPSVPSDEVLKGWLSHRKKRKLSITQLVVNKMATEINASVQSGYTVDSCLSEVVERGWQGFKSEWMNNSSATKTALHDVSNKTYYEGAL